VLRSKPGKVQSASVLYEPAVFAAGRIHYTNPKMEQAAERQFSLLAPFSPGGTVPWESAAQYPGAADDLISSPPPDARFSVSPETVRALKKFSAEKQALTNSLVYSQELKLFTCPAVKLISKPGEPENEFLLRVRLAAREQRDAEVDALRKKYEAKIETLEERLRKAESTADRKQADAEARKREAMLSAGETVIGVLLGRKSSRTGSAAASKYRQSSAAGMSANEAEENARALADDIQELREAFEKEAAGITSRWENAVKEIGQIVVNPKKTGIEITSFFLAWAPRWHIVVSEGAGSIRTERVDASL
jgi:hypothetical protein